MSRRAQPRAWQRAVAWLVGSGLHPRAGHTTLRVAADLAARMDYTLGTVLYDMVGTAARLGVSVPTVKRHVRVLRELGALVWLEHGTRRNLHLPGRKYAGTATVYGAVIPPAVDEAMGHRLAGSGYEARVIGVTEKGRARAVNAARTVTRSPRSRHDPPSPGRYPDVRKAELSGGLEDTRGRERRNSSPSTKTTTSRRRPGTGRPARQVARDIAIARQVRPLVGWTQREGLRRLAFALRPLIDEGLDVHEIAAELHAWFVDWRPARPAGWITACLRDRPAGGAPSVPTAEFRAAAAAVKERRADDVDQEPLVLEDLTRSEVVAMRSAAAADPGLVLAAIEHMGMRQARRLYTGRGVDEALLRAFHGAGRMVLHE